MNFAILSKIERNAMENASKALIMAGGLLISILVASFMILVLRKAGKINAEYDAQMSDNELARFNSQFELYAREDNTFFDVITVANLAYDINQRNGWDESNGVDVKIYDRDSSIAMYSILVTQNASNGGGLKKDYFFEKEDVVETTQEYIYGQIISENTAKKNDDESVFKYRFECKNEISYNEITGKVREIKFRRREN